MAVCLVLLLVGIPLVIARNRQDTPLRFGETVVDVGRGVGLPHDVSRHWLLIQVKSVADEHLGSTRIIGEVGRQLETRVYSRPWVARPWAKQAEVVDVTLRCQAEVCVFAITRNTGSREVHQQAVLLADMPLQQWHYVVREATQSVFR